MKIGPPDMHYKILGESFVVFGYNQNSVVDVRSIHAQNYFKYNTYVSACAPFDVSIKRLYPNPHK